MLTTLGRVFTEQTQGGRREDQKEPQRYAGNAEWC